MKGQWAGSASYNAGYLIIIIIIIFTGTILGLGDQHEKVIISTS